MQEGLTRGEQVKQQQGIAQVSGYVNRREYRKSIYADRRKTRNTQLNQIKEYTMGATRKGAPFYEPKRGKLKGWMKNLPKRKRK